MRFRTGLAAAVAAILLGSCATLDPLPTTTETLTWSFTSNHPNQVDVRFFSQDRSAVWPGGDRVYRIADWDRHTYRLTCRTGEKICYGAWLTGGDGSTYWGVGRSGREGCTRCCQTCGTYDAGHVTLQP